MLIVTYCYEFLFRKVHILNRNNYCYAKLATGMRKNRLKSFFRRFLKYIDIGKIWQVWKFDYSNPDSYFSRVCFFAWPRICFLFHDSCGTQVCQERFVFLDPNAADTAVHILRGLVATEPRTR